MRDCSTGIQFSGRLRGRAPTPLIHSVTEITPKSPFLCVNRIPIWYGFRVNAKAIRYYAVVGPGGLPPTLIFGPNWGWKGRKNFFLRLPSPHLISGSGWLPRNLIWRSGSASAVWTQPYAWVNTVPINIYNS